MMVNVRLRVLVIRKGACWVRKAREAVVIGGFTFLQEDEQAISSIGLEPTPAHA